MAMMITDRFPFEIRRKPRGTQAESDLIFLFLDTLQLSTGHTGKLGDASTQRGRLSLTLHKMVNAEKMGVGRCGKKKVFSNAPKMSSNRPAPVFCKNKSAQSLTISLLGV